MIEGYTIIHIYVPCTGEMQEPPARKWQLDSPIFWKSPSCSSDSFESSRAQFLSKILTDKITIRSLLYHSVIMRIFEMKNSISEEHKGSDARSDDHEL